MGAVVAVVIVAGGTTGTDLPDPDIWWNVADGLSQLRTGDAPLEMFGRHGCPDPLPLVTVLSARLLGVAWDAGGMWALVALRAVLVAVIALATASALGRLSLLERTAWAACVAAALSLRASPRPELVGLALFAVACALAARVLDAPDHRAPRAPLVGLAVVQAISVWTHGGFVFAPLVCGALVAGAVVGRDPRALRRALLALGAVMVGFLARPGAVLGFTQAGAERAYADALGMREWASPFALLADGWRPPGLGAVALVVLASALGAVWCLRFEGRARAAGALFVLVPLLALGLDAMRALAFCVCAAPVHLRLVADAPARARKLLAAAGAGAALLVALATLSVDPWLTLHAQPPAFAPARLTPLGPGGFLVEHPARGLVYAPLHAGNWLVLLEQLRLDAADSAAPSPTPRPALEVVWSGRRTYTAQCGAELLAGRDGGAFFDVVDARVRPDHVLVLHASEPALTDTLVARGFVLAYLDLRYAVFSRPGAAAGDASALVVDAGSLQAAETRPLDAVTFRALLASTCRTLQVAAPTHATATCEAVRRLPEGVGLDVDFGPPAGP